MAKPGRRKPCPKVPSPVEAVRGAVVTLFTAFLPGGDPAEAMERLRASGAHHELMQIAYPETQDLEGMAYGRAIDEFEGDLVSWLDEAARANAEHLRRMQERENAP